MMIMHAVCSTMSFFSFSLGAQQAVKQVIQQAHAQAQQRQTLQQPATLTLPTLAAAANPASTPTTSTATPPVVTQLPAAQTAVTAAGVLIQAPAAAGQIQGPVTAGLMQQQQGSAAGGGEKVGTYTMRLRNPPPPKSQ